MPEITIAAGSVSIQASAILRTVESCNPEPLAAMVPAMPEDNTWVVETGNPYTSAAAIVAAAVAYGNWIALGEPGFNANGSVADIFQNFANTTNTITNNSGRPFSFTSIGLADVYNQGTGGNILFTFNPAGGGAPSTTMVTLTSGILGLQSFTFNNENNLSSVVFTPTTTNGPFIQFDNVDVSPITTTPLPSTWTMLIVGFIALGFFAYRGTKKGSVALATV